MEPDLPLSEIKKKYRRVCETSILNLHSLKTMLDATLLVILRRFILNFNNDFLLILLLRQLLFKLYHRYIQLLRKHCASIVYP